MSDLISRKAAIDAITNYAKYLWDKFHETCNLAGMIETIEALPSVQRWIPVSERLPELNNVYKKDVLPYYLVQNEYGDMMVATFIKSNGEARVWQQIYQYGEIMDEIVAWMPLPEPWKGEEG